MRRVDREVKDPSVARYILDACKEANFGFWDGKEPYVVPMNFGYKFEADKLFLYMHSALEGRKIEILKSGFDTVAVELDCDHNLYLSSEVVCSSGMGFKSLMGIGRCRLLEGEQKLQGLQYLFEHQAGVKAQFPAGAENAVNVLCLEVERYSVKVCNK